MCDMKRYIDFAYSSTSLYLDQPIEGIRVFCLKDVYWKMSQCKNLIVFLFFLKLNLKVILPLQSSFSYVMHL
jgi:hypothetical protein